MVKTLSELLTAFGNKNEYRKLDLLQSYSIVEENIESLKKTLRGPEKTVATIFLNHCKKVKSVDQLLMYITETMFKLSNMSEDL